MGLRGVGLAVLAATGLAVAFFVHIFFMLTTCAGPTPEIKPAEASPHGWVCGDEYSIWTPMLFGFAAAALSLPPDQCSAEAKRDRPGYECETRTGV